MPNELILLLFPFVASITNRFPRGILSFGPFITGPILGGMLYVATGSWMLPLVFVALYLIGESFGWGKWLNTVRWWNNNDMPQEAYNQSAWVKRDDGQNIGIHQLANAISPETKNYKRYAQIALFLRGMFWWGPIFAALAIMGYTPIAYAVVATLIAGIAFPLSYGIAYKFEQKLPFKAYWTQGELIYGFVFGCLIAAAFLF